MKLLSIILSLALLKIAPTFANVSERTTREMVIEAVESRSMTVDFSRFLQPAGRANEGKVNTRSSHHTNSIFELKDNISIFISYDIFPTTMFDNLVQNYRVRKNRRGYKIEFSIQGVTPHNPGPISVSLNVYFNGTVSMDIRRFWKTPFAVAGRSYQSYFGTLRTADEIDRD